MENILIKQSDDYDSLKILFIKNGLEVGNEPVPTDIIKCWHAKYNNEEKHLIGGATLGLRGGVYIVDGIAVEPEYRNRDIGTDMLDKLIAYAKKIGVKELWLVAIAPQFFRKYGFTTINRKSSPNIFGCFNCKKYGKECKPEVMRMDI